MNRITYKTLNELESRAPTPEELVELRRGYARFLDGLGSRYGADPELEELARELYVQHENMTTADAFANAEEFQKFRAKRRGQNGP
jgi:hypothetical protein